MQTHREALWPGDPVHSGSNYMGDIIPDNFKILLSRKRDSLCLDESNWRVALKKLGGESETVRIDRFGSWAGGWFEHLSIDENDKERFELATKMEEDMEAYPVLDEEDYSALATEEADKVWKDCYNFYDRMEWMRENKGDTEYHDYADMLSAARGTYFPGHATDLTP